MLNLRGRINRKSKGKRERDEVQKTKSDVDFDFGMAEEAKDGSDERTNGRRMAKGREANSRGNDRKKSTKQGGVRAEKGKVDGRWLRKTWSDVAKGMNED